MAFETALKVEAKKLMTLPLRCSECGLCEWNQYCDSERRSQKVVTKMAGVDNRLSKKLVDANLSTYDRVAKQSPAELVK